MTTQARANVADIRDQYSNLTDMWVDSWHRRTYQRILRYMQRFVGKRSNENWGQILNLGSGGNPYDISGETHVHVDLVLESLRGVDEAIVGTAEKLPFKNSSFDLCICVGSVINYCDASLLIEEAGRILKPGASFVLEFERSASAEYVGREGYGADQCQMLTKYGEREVTLWFYSEKYIDSLLEANGLSMKRLVRFHVLSPLLFRVTGWVGFSALFAGIDVVARYLPYVRRLSTNAILLAVKTDATPATEDITTA